MQDLPGLDTSRPHTARMYDFFLNGKNHFAADRELAEQVLATTPSARIAARENRAFLGRAVRYLTGEAGIRQFLDIGTGLPATSNVHQVAQEIAPESRVLYADNDPLVLAHARALLTSSPEGRTGYIQADLRDPETILSSPEVRDILDLTRPVALMLVAVLHFLPDAHGPAEAIATLLDALPDGSYLVASHTTAEHDPEQWAPLQRAYESGGIPGQFRDHDEFARLAFTGLNLVPPGVVLASEWRPDPRGSLSRPTPAEVSVYAGVARKG